MQLSEDLISAIIRPVRLESAFVSLWQINGNWSLAGPRESCPLFHYVSDGKLTISNGREQPIFLNQGDLALFPHGSAHHISTSETEISVPLERFIPAREKGQFIKVDVPGTRRPSGLLCAGLYCESHSAAPIYKLLPESIVIRKHQIEAEPLLQGALEGLLREVEHFQEDKRFVLHRGLELIYVLGLRLALDAVQIGDRGTST